MTLGRIKLLALRQLDEDPQDIGEYDTLFTAYANMGYALAVRDYLKPREEREIRTDEAGHGVMEKTDIVRVLELRDEGGKNVPFFVSAEGGRLVTARRAEKLTAVCEVMFPEMELETDEPKLPETVHAALADYICYRHLSTGSLAKQQKAQFYLVNFLRQMRAIRHAGGPDRFHYLYTVTDSRYTG